jgi:hypothetical protein
MKKSNILEVICFLIILLFVYTGVSKFIHHENFKIVIGRIPILNPFTNVLSLGLPLSELVAAVLLMFPATRRWGLYLSAVLMSAFTMFIVYVIFISSHVPCVCGGIISRMTWKQHLVFNSFFTFAAFAAIRLHKQNTSNINEVEGVQFT